MEVTWCQAPASHSPPPVSCQRNENLLAFVHNIHVLVSLGRFFVAVDVTICKLVLAQDAAAYLMRS